uniref:Transcription factor E4F1 n=1 Tax=Poecilia mexicana TaxID=48701 RepID=A0A3B3XQ45_9TELE
MNAENNHTAETEKEQTTDGTDTITIQTTLGDEDDDVHKCGRCRCEFSSLEAFIQHKLQQSCKRLETRQASQETNHTALNFCYFVLHADERNGPMGRGHRKKIASIKVTDQSDNSATFESENADGEQQTFKVNQEGRYICHLCEKTFKTTNILRTHMKTHSDQKNFSCSLCGTSFRTKGSLIRHNRRHTDERPYRCTLCGQSFRESGALTRHLKSLTPCTEKIRFVQYKEILVSKDGVQKAEEQEMVEAQTAVVSVVEAGSQEVLRQVVVDQSQADALAAAAAAGDSLICQAIINSGIALGTEETVVEESSPAAQELDKDIPDATDVDQSVIEIQEAAEDRASCKLYTCPHCSRSFKGVNYFRFHVKGHLGYKPFKCTLCQKEFLTGYLLKKHMEVHVSERRYKCGECGKLYKTIGHVREHMRAHSDERPYHCHRCNKGYKTKNALQVHQRTHGDEKPYVCEFCFRGFREKGSLVRHIRHHTGERPFKCPKCGRGFAEHGTLNRHMRAKGQGDVQKQTQNDSVIAEDPHALLVEFSSVVADTQEYIIKVGAKTHKFRGQLHRETSAIMKVVQQIVSQSHGAASHQIIVRNVGADEESASISDCGDTITIATPESLTEQVAMTLASAISDGTLLATTGTAEDVGGTVTMVTTEEAVEGIQMVQQQEEYVITSPEEVEIQTVVV